MSNISVSKLGTSWYTSAEEEEEEEEEEERGGRRRKTKRCRIKSVGGMWPHPPCIQFEASTLSCSL
jgi:hypothetical protein